MIKINLLGEKEDHSASYALHLLAFAATVVCTCAVCLFVYIESSTTLDEMRSEKSQLQARLTTLQAQTKKVHELEQKRRLLREKLLTIATLKARKHGPVHILDDINAALPERAWLVSVGDKSGSLELTGIALDDPTVAAFMYSLERSNYFAGIELVQSAEEVVNEIRMKKFAVIAKLKDLLAAKKEPAGPPAQAAKAEKTAAGA